MQASKANASSVVTSRQIFGRRERIGSRFHKLKNGSNNLIDFIIVGLFSTAKNIIRTSAGVDNA
jgi:hypothetical protein